MAAATTALLLDRIVNPRTRSVEEALYRHG
jgi:hypothetical protein